MKMRRTPGSLTLRAGTPMTASNAIKADTRSISSRTAFGALSRFARHHESRSLICASASLVTSMCRGELPRGFEAQRAPSREEQFVPGQTARSIREACARFQDLLRRSARLRAVERLPMRPLEAARHQVQLDHR